MLLLNDLLIFNFPVLKRQEQKLAIAKYSPKHMTKLKLETNIQLHNVYLAEIL